jgi:hypothetical protein
MQSISPTGAVLWLLLAPLLSEVNDFHQSKLKKSTSDCGVSQNESKTRLRPVVDEKVGFAR